jgi:hypothetical protein
MCCNITIVIQIKKKVLVDAEAYSEHGKKVITCDFKPGSVERSIDVCMQQQRRRMNMYYLIAGGQ